MDFLVKTPRKVMDLSKPIVCTMESFQQLENAELVSKDGNIFKSTLIECDTISRNKTRYPLDDVLRSLQDSVSIQDKINNKCWMGEAEHPINPDGTQVTLKRFLRVEPSRWAIRIDNYEVVGSNLVGTIQFAGEFGSTYRDLLVNHGSNLAMSIRAYSPKYVKKQDPVHGAYVEKLYQMHPVTFDIVTVPGLRNSRIMDPDKFAEMTKNEKLSVKSDVSQETYQELVYNNVIDNIRELMTSEEGSDFISEVYGVDFSKDKLVIDGDNMLVVSLEDGGNLHIPMNDALVSSIL